jgi:hypothetical protein
MQPSVRQLALATCVLVLLLALVLNSCTTALTQTTTATDDPDRSVSEHVGRLLSEGRHIFRFDTFGSEIFWGDAVKLHQAIQGEKLGRV